MELSPFTLHKGDQIGFTRIWDLSREESYFSNRVGFEAAVLKIYWIYSTESLTAL